MNSLGILLATACIIHFHLYAVVAEKREIPGALLETALVILKASLYIVRRSLHPVWKPQEK